MNFVFIFTMDKPFKYHFIGLEILLTMLTGIVIYYVSKESKEKAE